MTRRVYLDYNGSTPIAPEVAAVMRAAIDQAYGNPSSPHWAGVPARQTVEKARGQVANAIGCAPQEVVFTSGGSEKAYFSQASARSGTSSRHKSNIRQSLNLAVSWNDWARRSLGCLWMARDR